MLTLQSDALREAGMALGAGRGFVIRTIIWKAAGPGILTGGLLGFARISGETAPLLFTSLGNQFLALNLSEPMASLPTTIFQFALSAYDGLAATRLGGRAADRRCRACLPISSGVWSAAGVPDMNTSTMNPPAIPGLEEAEGYSVAPPPADQLHLDVRELNFFYGKNQALFGVELPVARNKITALIGPSGCGKSTLLRTINRIYELYPGQRAEGQILLDGEDLLHGMRAADVRARIGMVFQKPTPFPMSIYDNIAFGVRLYRKVSQAPRWTGLSNAR